MANVLWVLGVLPRIFFSPVEISTILASTLNPSLPFPPLSPSLPPLFPKVTIILDRNGTTKQNQDSDMMKLFFALFSERYPGKEKGREGLKEGGGAAIWE